MTVGHPPGTRYRIVTPSGFFVRLCTPCQNEREVWRVYSAMMGKSEAELKRLGYRVEIVPAPR